MKARILDSITQTRPSAALAATRLSGTIRLRVLAAALLVAMLLAACGPQEETSAPSSVIELTDMAEEYISSYRADFTVRPRPADGAMEAAEAYLRLHQPGVEPRVFQSTFIYDRYGTQLAEIFDEGRRTWTPLQRISPHLIDAIIATEDASFFNNVGIDARRVLAALIQNTESGDIVSGASTITMQLARNLFFAPDRRFEQDIDRKVYEVLMAADLTELFTKDEILEMYLNLANFGHLAYGPEAAARTYFGKSAANLTLAEATLLAGIPQKPATYDLFTGMAAAKQRQRIVLDLMVRHGYLSRAEADAVFNENVKLAADPNNVETLAPHFVQFVADTMDDRLGIQDVRRAGLRIFTTLDLKMQDLAQEIVSTNVRELGPRYNLTNAALVAIKPGTAEVLVMVGSADYSDERISGKVNIAASLRQPGSSVKPLLYATAFNDNLISPATVLWDIPVEYRINEWQVYRPRNYDSRFHGPVTARTALANSYNIPAVKLLDWVGIDRMVESATALGVKTWPADGTYGLGLTLGSNEVTLYDLTTAYHTLANGGRYLPGEPILYILDAQGRLVDERSKSPGTQVVSAEAAYLTTNILSDNLARAPAFGRNSILALSRPAAAKTGTTTSWRDNWTLGYTRYLVVGVWAGNANGAPMRNVTGITGAAPIWSKFMEAVIADRRMAALLDAPDNAAEWEFPRPDGILTRPIECAANVICPEGEEVFAADWRDALRTSGVLSDSFVHAAGDTVYADIGSGDQIVGYCTPAAPVRAGSERLMFVLPVRAGPLEAPLQLVAEPELLSRPDELALPVEPRLPTPVKPRGVARLNVTTLSQYAQAEQIAVIRWARQRDVPLLLGPCDQMAAVLQTVYGERVQEVTVRQTAPRLAASERENEREERPITATPVTATPEAEATPQVETTSEVAEEAAPTPTPQPAVAATGGGSYQLAALYHDDNCPGNYIMGVVLNRDGGPVAGVRVRAVDQFGNQSDLVSKNGQGDFGRFDLPINTDAARQFTLTVLDDGGATISGAITVDHVGGNGTGCHHVVFQRLN